MTRDERPRSWLVFATGDRVGAAMRCWAAVALVVAIAVAALRLA
jgi:hypothetical protein